MRTLEWVAVAFGLVNVYLAARQRPLSWPVGLVNVALFAVIFWRARLYADAGLQVVYAALSLFGWWQWVHGGPRRTQLPVTRTPPREALALAVAAPAFAFALATFLARNTDAAIPYLDSSLTAASLAAQYLLTRKRVENWLVWIAVDIVYVPTFLSRGLTATAVQYAVFLVLAGYGWWAWRRTLISQES